MTQLKVALSPFYVKESFLDEVSGITFEKSKASAIYPYSISNGAKLDGIRKAIRLNILVLLEGTLPEQEVVIPEVKVATPVVEEVKAEEPVEVVAEEEVKAEEAPAPKPKTTTKRK